MDYKKNLLTVYWILAIAPFITAVPLYILMPDLVVPYDGFRFPDLGHRAGIFVFPAGWFLVNVIMYFVLKWLDRQIEGITKVLLVVLIALCLVFSTAAIVMELSFYRSAMTFY
ncbi:MAG: hypothetical protein PHR78_07570 [Eubacteriales bacterium]|nr:hypothetical protein [Eubacteriales bacterium]MDD4541997.1 hypothetical protein [Eubacteriales bacterium]